MGFNLADYQPVEDRLRQFWEENEAGRVSTDLVTHTDTQYIVKADVWRDINDPAPAATGYAHEIATQRGVNATSALENCECVPLNVPALTRKGWKFFHQIHVGDELLTYSIDHKELEWQPVQRVSTFTDQPLVRIGNTRFTADCTANHKWVIDGQLTPWEQHPANGRILLASRVPDGGDRVADAQRLGWLFGDCQLSYNDHGQVGRAEVRQSKEENLAELRELFGEPTRVTPAGARDWGDGRISETREALTFTIPAAEVRRILGRFRVNTRADVMQAVCDMAADELDAFTGAMMRSDGTQSGTYGKTSKELAAAMQVAFFLSGSPTSTVSERAGNSRTTKPCYVVTRHKTAAKWLREFKETPLPPQDVWCPTTRNGTWVGLFSGRPAITGNTSAIGRALANLGYAPKGKRPSREEMAKAAPTTDPDWLRDAGIGLDEAKTREELEIAVAFIADGVKAGKCSPESRADLLAKFEARKADLA